MDDVETWEDDGDDSAAEEEAVITELALSDLPREEKLARLRNFLEQAHPDNDWSDDDVLFGMLTAYSGGDIQVIDETDLIDEG